MGSVLGSIGLRQIYKFLKYTLFSATWYFSVSFEDFRSETENGTIGLARLNEMDELEAKVAFKLL